MIAAIQPIFIKSVTTSVTAAVATAIKQMQLQAVETIKGEVKRVKDNMARLQARVQTQHFEQDRQAKCSRKDSVRIYGIQEPENEHPEKIRTI